MAGVQMTLKWLATSPDSRLFFSSCSVSASSSDTSGYRATRSLLIGHHRTGLNSRHLDPASLPGSYCSSLVCETRAEFLWWICTLKMPAILLLLFHGHSLSDSHGTIARVLHVLGRLLPPQRVRRHWKVRRLIEMPALTPVLRTVTWHTSLAWV